MQRWRSKCEPAIRVALARAITLIESRKPEHRPQARQLLTLLNSDAGRSQRVGITGIPGVGKSTLIDALGSYLTAQGHRVAVLAVDPSSSRSGGAILGDKTRMARLAADPNAFIRPSPSSGTLGGVARTTRETILLCEAAGFDVVLVETVGVGQSEIAVAGMVDFFLVLMLAGGGDELQGIKKGVMELADMIAITKADGGNEGPARAAAGDYKAALHILTPPSTSWKPPVITISAREGHGLDELWANVTRHRAALEASGEFEAKRRDQDVSWMHAMIEERMRQMFVSNGAAAAKIAELEAKVRSGAMPRLCRRRRSRLAYRWMLMNLEMAVAICVGAEMPSETARCWMPFHPLGEKAGHGFQTVIPAKAGIHFRRWNKTLDGSPPARIRANLDAGWRNELANLPSPPPSPHGRGSTAVPIERASLLPWGEGQDEGRKLRSWHGLASAGTYVSAYAPARGRRCGSILPAFLPANWRQLPDLG